MLGRRCSTADRLPVAHGRRVLKDRMIGWIFVAVALTLVPIFGGAAPSAAVEVGQPAPDFKLPSTMGGDVSLSAFRGKKWVLLEFYGADFAPT
jgi:hypothetical protein